MAVYRARMQRRKQASDSNGLVSLWVGAQALTRCSTYFDRSLLAARRLQHAQEHYSEQGSSSDSELNTCEDNHVSDAQNLSETPLEGEGETGQSSDCSQEGCICAAAHVSAILSFI